MSFKWVSESANGIKMNLDFIILDKANIVKDVTIKVNTRSDYRIVSCSVKCDFRETTWFSKIKHPNKFREHHDISGRNQEQTSVFCGVTKILDNIWILNLQL